jgi:UDP-N-acetylmuramate dehydrogenase
MTDGPEVISEAAKTGIHLEQDCPISKLTTFGIGGPADLVAFCSTAAGVVNAVEICQRRQIDYFIMGGGSNILASDKGYRGMIIIPQIKDFEIQDNVVICGAGQSLQQVVESTVAAGLAGMELLAGIAGTVGGAIVGNAGAYGSAISDHLLDVYLYHPVNGFHTEMKENLDYRYRGSSLKGSSEVVISARFRLEQGDAAQLQEKTRDILSERWKRHPRQNVSAGCFFKNVESENAPHGKIAAGYLLEQVGGKEMTVGRAGVYSAHANILINKGGASASEVRELSIRLKAKVKQAFGVDLCEEVVLLGDFS